MTDSRRAAREILKDIREAASQMRALEDDLEMTREWLADLLLEGDRNWMQVTRLAREAGISRQTAHKLIRQARPRRVAEMAERLEELEDWHRDGELPPEGIAELNALRDDPELREHLDAEAARLRAKLSEIEARRRATTPTRSSSDERT